MRKSSKRLLLLIAIFAVAITVRSALLNWSQTARVQSNQEKAKPIDEKAIPIVGYDESVGHQRKESTIEPQYLELRTLRNTNCQSPPQHGSSWSKWPQKAEVDVVIDSRYSTQEQDAIKAAFNNWQASRGLSGNRSGVTFDFTVGPITGTPGASQVQVRKRANTSSLTTDSTEALCCFKVEGISAKVVFSYY